MKPLYAVVSLLDAPSYGLVEQLWSELRQRCGIAGIYKTPFPHFSYHVAAEYDMNRLESRLRTLARRMAPFRVCTSGLGIFTGYGAGMVRLSLGDNSELGGRVSGGDLRWLFFPDATVTAGPAILVAGGRLAI